MFYKVCGKRVDEYMFKLFYDNFGAEDDYPEISEFEMFKLKTDLKETSFAPYKIPFNYQVLIEKQDILNSMGMKDEA